MAEQSKENQWLRMWFKSNKAYILCNAQGEPIIENGRAKMVYKPDDSRVYAISAANVRPLDDPPPKPKKSRVAETKKTTETVSTAPDSKAIVVYTDGACSGNPGPAGSGVVLLWGEHRKEISRYLGEGTNNVAELVAIQIALETITRPNLPVKLHTDSSYAIGVLKKGWKAKKNQELIENIRNLMTKYPFLELIKVPGHHGVPENERADELARLAVERKADGP